ncbi:hypothetical protein GCM10010988_05760 [Cnuibacter physcomitrellae]|uniref:Uncharacterized protein n=1 Tax=Cnuibacter physcomitrellae TaxID=1619308 RepID=A0A1X9LK29_9MICO|nr:hypothetical protein [Cnuibacter physcomitrellae]ARJ05487.1 hypothetical protein B5808_09815 [Cnuibacter physcomitrellae]GGI35799.1 hypothetical protein GCM10010988_05760 [Cnuibacter physcomitrellae]
MTEVEELREQLAAERAETKKWRDIARRHEKDWRRHSAALNKVLDALEAAGYVGSDEPERR